MAELSTQNTLLTSQLIIQKLDKALKLDSTFLNFSSKEFQGEMTSQKEYLPGTNISILMLQYPRAYFGQNLSGVNAGGYTSQVYNITLENRGFINVMQSYDTVQTAFQMGKFVEQFIYPTHKTIRKAIEFYTIEKLNKTVTHVPVSSLEYKAFVRNYLAGLNNGNTIGTAPMVNYMNRMDAYMHAMNLAHEYTHFMSPMAVASVMQSMMTLISPSIVSGIAEDAKVGRVAGREIIRSSELVNNNHLKAPSKYGIIEDDLAANLTTVSGSFIGVSKDYAVTIDPNKALAMCGLVFPQRNTFNLSYVGIPLAVDPAATDLQKVATEIAKAKVLWAEGETLCIYGGPGAAGKVLADPLAKGKVSAEALGAGPALSVEKANCVGFTNQISQMNVGNYFTLTNVASPNNDDIVISVAKDVPNATHIAYVRISDSNTNLMPLGEQSMINSGTSNRSRDGGPYLNADSAPTFRSTYLGPAISNLPSEDINLNNDFCAAANSLGWNFQDGRVGPFSAKSLRVMTSASTAIEGTSGTGSRVVIAGGSSPALITSVDFGGAIDNYTYKNGQVVLIPEWEFTISKETLYIINPPVTQMHGIDCSITQDDSARLKYRSSIFGFIESSVNLWRIDTLIGVGVTPIYNMTFPMPVGLST